jgi:hypothetical protein
MDRSRAGQGLPAPYGHACANCSKAKCKCIYRDDGGTCERCHRLNKECRLPTRVRRRKATRPVGTRNALLEEKLEDLVSVLRSQAIPKSSVDTAPDSDPSRDALITGHTGGSLSSNLLSAAAHVADEHLEVFRTCMLNFFPFVYIPPSSTAKDLRHERPFFWLCIMCIAAKSTSQQTAIAGQIWQIICQRVVKQNERSIDLLLGLICYIGW